MSGKENPAPDLFTTYERIEVCHRVEVTEDNMPDLARHFGWSVNYATETPQLVRPGSTALKPGAQIDHRGSTWNAPALEQGWSPKGTFSGGAV